MKLRIFRSPLIAATVAALAFSLCAPAASAEEAKEVTLSLMADGDAEAPSPKLKWSVRAVVKNEQGLWVYDTARNSPNGHSAEGLEIEMKLPEGAWEVFAFEGDTPRGRVILDVSEELAKNGWAVSDHGEPYALENQPTQWYISADSDGPTLAGAPPIAEAADFEFEVVGAMINGALTKELQVTRDAMLQVKFAIPEGFTGTVEMRPAENPKANSLYTVAAEALAAAETQILPLPRSAGYYDIRVIDPQRRTVINHVITVK